MLLDDAAKDEYGAEGFVDRDPYKVAEDRGLVVRLPAPHELFIDIDSEEAFVRFEELLEIYNRGREKQVTHQITDSPSGTEGHCHVVVDLLRPVKDEFERVALQALLGSDPKREALGWRRCETGMAPVTVFFEKPASTRTGTA